MSWRYEARLSGSGGQGLILAGKILAEAAAIYEDKNATQSQSYGPEARGGASRSEVILSDGDIDFPKATHLDLLLCLTQEACDKYMADLKPEGLLIADSRFVRNIPGGRHRVVPVAISDIAENEVGRSVTANMVALGVIVGATGILKPESVERAISARVPRGSEELNIKAFRLGMAAARP
ncbi:MAG: 2-oxoacid:ferredoxin oxidoreductase subunit gamma [Deltaproteobacteria bacterium]|nr:2-oxoacid:ferredoxin oxidoreductase subunit gamma [Deltaproteobacteria bacterium]